MTADRDKAERTLALSRLAIATRERVEKQTLDVYIDDFKAWSTPTFVEACRRLHGAGWFPKVKELTEACQAVAREAEIRAEARRLKPAPDAVSPERMAEFMAQIRRVIGKKSMPGATAPTGDGE